MKTKKLNSTLFGNMELRSADMINLKGGQATVVDSCYSGCGKDATTGGMVNEICVVFDNGDVDHIFIPCAVC